MKKIAGSLFYLKQLKEVCMTYKKANEVNFDDFIKENKNVIIDFSAQWCGPCKVFEPVFKEVSEEFEGKVAFLKVDVDESREIAAKYGIRSIPTLISLKNGEVENTTIGSMRKSQFKEIVEKLLK